MLLCYNAVFILVRGTYRTRSNYSNAKKKINFSGVREQLESKIIHGRSFGKIRAV